MKIVTKIKISLMKAYKLFFLLFISFSLGSCVGGVSSSQQVAEGSPPAIIPLPNNIEWGDRLYKIPSTTKICLQNGAQVAGEWLKELLVSSGYEAKIVEGTSCGQWNLSLDPALKAELGEEGYVLNISEEGIELKSSTEAGLFYGIQTLRQMFPPEVETEIPLEDPVYLRHVSIEDNPHFEWRGTMVDVARSFFGLEYLKNHVDRMALYKMNRLHLHLSDDQGWRIEIKSRPKLTEIGSKGSTEGGNSGFLTQEEYLELQDYAAARNIIIVPEIDMPGHVYSALASYPELNCEGYKNLTPARATPPELYSGYEVGWSKLCLEDPKIYDFVADVLGEVASITKGPWIHIGGDEIEDPRYEEFVVKADSIVRQLGKTTIGWQEITQAPVSSSAISQEWWEGEGESVVDLRVIHSFCSNFYLDHANVPGQENTLNWCKKDGVSLEDVYSFRSENPKALGVEAPVWTEHVLNDKMLDDRFWPRALAVAELGWTVPAKLEYESFLNRLQEQARRIRALGINHHPTPEINWEESEISEEPTSVFADFEL